MINPLNIYIYIYGVKYTIYINTGGDSSPSNYPNFGATSNSADAALAARDAAQRELEATALVDRPHVGKHSISSQQGWSRIGRGQIEHPQRYDISATLARIPSCRSEDRMPAHVAARTNIHGIALAVARLYIKPSEIVGTTAAGPLAKSSSACQPHLTPR